MEKLKTHKDLLVWQKSLDMVVSIYEITKHYPKEELYALTNQIRRCATSIPANIAEGSGRKSDSELIQFLHISLGSASELETFMIISQRLGFINNESFRTISEVINEIIRMLTGLINSIKNKKIINNE